MISEQKVFIKEAGEHCQRNVDLNRFGMELNKKGIQNLIIFLTHLYNNILNTNYLIY